MTGLFTSSSTDNIAQQIYLREIGLMLIDYLVWLASWRNDSIIGICADKVNMSLISADTRVTGESRGLKHVTISGLLNKRRIAINS